MSKKNVTNPHDGSREVTTQVDTNHHSRPLFRDDDGCYSHGRNKVRLIDATIQNAK